MGDLIPEGFFAVAGATGEADLPLDDLAASLAVLAEAVRAAWAEACASCLWVSANEHTLRSSQRGHSGSVSRQVSLATSSIRSRNSAPRFLGTARSRIARRAEISDSEIPTRSSTRCAALSIGIACPPKCLLNDGCRDVVGREGVVCLQHLECFFERLLGQRIEGEAVGAIEELAEEPANALGLFLRVGNSREGFLDLVDTADAELVPIEELILEA